MGRFLPLSVLLLIVGCAPLAINYTSEVSNPIRVKANILVKFDEENLASQLQERTVRQSVIDAVRTDLQQSLFYTGSKEVDVVVRIQKLQYSNSPWGLFWLPLVVIGAPVGKVESEAVIAVEIRSTRGELLRAYRADHRESLWYNSVYYNKMAPLGTSGGILRDVLKITMEQIKNLVIEDKYRIVQALEAPVGQPLPSVVAGDLVPFADVDLNVPKTATKNPEAIAVVIGVAEYQDPDVPKVEYAVQDAGFMRQYLIHALGYDEKNILPRDPLRPVTAGVLKTLIRQQLASFVKPGISDVFVYFSGHGAPSLSNRKAYLVPADCNPNFVSDDNAYALESLYDDLAKIPARSLTVVLDACFSGMGGGGQMLIRNASPIMITVQHPLLARENAVIFAASTGDQVSNWFAEKKHGMFTYFFLKGLQGEADGDRNGELTVDEMRRYIMDENSGVPFWSQREHQRRQTPQVITKDLSRILVTY